MSRLEKVAASLASQALPSALYLGRVRDECLNINLSWSLTQARVIITDWKDEYNNHRWDLTWAT